MNKHERHHRRHGFTLVELLVVISVLGILAGISVFSVQNWRTSSARTEVGADMRSVLSAMNNRRNFDNAYPVFTPNSTFGASGPSANRTLFRSSAGVTLTYRSGSATVFCIQGSSVAVTSVVMHVEQDGVISNGVC